MVDQPACSGCGFSNRLGARFCSGCGQQLSIACPSCSSAAEPGERFCNQCGASLALAPAPARTAEGERKQVTVLFADVVGSMALAERLDADELTEVMQGLFAVCRDAVESFGGTVDKFTGDGIMALFGAPVAQEDHARRACHAALQLIDRAREYALTLRQDIELGVRVGLNSGEVVAGSVGDSFTAVGHTVGLAQRMESAADPNSIQVTAYTAALLGGAFALVDLGPVTVKGSTEPVHSFRLGPATGGSSASGRRRAGSARMVGRDDELAVLEGALHDAQSGHARVIGLVGEAGAGKSRLSEELARRAVDLGVTVRRTAGVSHAQSVPLLPILGFLRDLFAIDEGEGPAEIRDKVARRLLELDAAFEADLGLMFDFMEVPDPERPAPQLGPEARRARVLELFRRATARRSTQQTVLFVFEDLHWFDAHSVRFLEDWLPTFPGTRTLVVTNFRPEFHAPWTARSYYRQLPLAPLERSAVTELFDQLLGSDPSMAILAEQLLARSGGNPFFVEEIVRALATDGTLDGSPGAYRLTSPVSEVRVPATVQVVLAGRIDRLDPADKSVLQSAAVIGRTFTDHLLSAVRGEDRAVTAAGLRRLCGEELLQGTGLDGEYRFWHALTQEVAYGSLVNSSRRRLHANVAAALIGLGPERHDELAPLVVTHFEAAGEDLEAARWQLRAASRAVHGDLAEAHRRWRSTVDHLAGVPESSETLALGVRARTQMLRFGARTGMDLVEADRLWGEARPAAERLGDPVLLAGLAQADGAVRWHNGECAQSLDSFREFCRQADQVGERVLRTFAWASRSALYAWTGPLPNGLAHVGTAVELCADDLTLGIAQVGYSVHDLLDFLRALLSAPAGLLREADAAARTALSQFEQRPSTEWQAWTLAQLALVATLVGDTTRLDEARDCARAARHLAEDSGNIGTAVRASLAEGASLLAEAPGSAAAVLTEALAHARKHRSGLMSEAELLSYLTQAQLALGDHATARATADEAVAVARRQGARVSECLAHAVRAATYRRSAVGATDVVAARDAVSAGQALAAETGAATYAAFLAEERARLEEDPGALETCAEGYDAIGASGHARRIREELGT